MAALHARNALRLYEHVHCLVFLADVNRQLPEIRYERCITSHELVVLSTQAGHLCHYLLAALRVAAHKRDAKVRLCESQGNAVADA